MSLVPGVRIGGYEILATLGAGGMGEVYRARDTRLKRNVALKILPETFANDPDRLARFQREAEVLGALNHPLIAHIYGIEESPASGDATAVFSRAIIMELVEGEDLAERIARGAIPVDEALPIARQIAEALEAAHEQGIIHRDLKPANIKVRPDGTVKVLDFGLAKALEASAGPAKAVASPSVLNSPTITTPAMTMQGMILGTAAYMAPEQAKGHAADKRSDVWAFGCVLFEMLTGRRPFDGEDVSDTLALVLKGEPDWVTLPAAVPPAVTTLLRRCLERDRRRRIASIATATFVIDEAASLAQGAASGHDGVAARATIAAAVADARRRLLRRRVLPAAVILTLAVALAGAAAWRFSAAPPAAPIARFMIALPAAERLPSIGRGILTISSDGTQVAYIGSGRLFVRRLSDQDAREIDVSTLASRTTPTLHSLAFSPDNRSLAFFAGSGVMRISLAGGAAVNVCTIAAPYGLTWHDSGIIAGLGNQGIVRCPVAGGPPESLASVEPGEQAHGPQVLPGGKHLLFTVARAALGQTRWDQAQLVVQPIEGGARKVVLQNGADGRYVRTGHLLYALDGVVLAAPFDLEKLEISGESVSVIEGVRRTLAWVTGVAQFATSETGTLIYVPGPARTSGERVLAFADRSGVVTRLDIPPGLYDHVRASPDGKRLAVGTDDGQQAIVWMLDLTGKGALQRLTQEGRNLLPIWSPDGQRLAFQSDRGGDQGIYAQRIDGTGVERLTTAAPGEAHMPESWSPDGRHLLFSNAKDGRFTLQVLAMESRTVAAFGAPPSEEPSNAVFSPDGKWVVYTVGLSGGRQSPDRGVYVQPFPATGAVYQVPRVGLDFHPVWTRDGAEIVLVPSAVTLRHAAVAIATRAGVSFATPALFPARVTARRTSGQRRIYDILPDGRFVGAVVADEPDPASTDDLDSEIRVVLNWFEELTQRSPVR